MLFWVNFLRMIARFTAFQIVFRYCFEEVREEPVYVEALLKKKNVAEKSKDTANHKEIQDI